MQEDRSQILCMFSPVLTVCVIFVVVSPVQSR